MYLAWELEEVVCYRTATASSQSVSQSLCPCGCAQKRRHECCSRRRQSQRAGHHITYVLSFACFKLSRNCRPLVVVDSAVSAFAFDSACTQTAHCQQARPSCPSVLLSLYASSAAVVMLPWHGGAGGRVKGYLSNPVVALHPGAIPHRDRHRSTAPTSCEPPPTMPSTRLGTARTGTFWRFAGRPSPSPIAALAALRLAALSIFADFAVA